MPAPFPLTGRSNNITFETPFIYFHGTILERGKKIPFYVLSCGTSFHPGRFPFTFCPPVCRTGCKEDVDSRP